MEYGFQLWLNTLRMNFGGDSCNSSMYGDEALANGAFAIGKSIMTE